MRVTFRRFPGHAAAYSVIERDDGVVCQLPGAAPSGARLPHDLRQLVVERELAVDDGLWGSVAAGIADRSMMPGLITARRLADLVEAVAMLDSPSEDEIRRLAESKLAVLADPPPPTPAELRQAARALQVEAARWARLRAGEELVYSWPAASSRPLRAVPRPREAGDPRRVGKRRPR